MNQRLQLPTENPIELAMVAQISIKSTAGFVLFNIKVTLINNKLYRRMKNTNILMSTIDFQLKFILHLDTF